MKNNYGYYMNTIREVTDDIYWIGGNDHRLALFENIFPIPKGVSYNSFFIQDEKTAVLDSVDLAIARDYLENIREMLQGKPLDYLIINHMEPDHCSAIELCVNEWPELKLVSTEQGFDIMRQLRYRIDEERIQIVKEGDSLSLGKHELHFVEAPMVHWPEVMMTYDATTKTLFSADAFGSFGALEGALFTDEVDWERDWLDDARRYYTNIVGKYGPHVMNALKKASTLDIKYICPLHGLVWRENIPFLLEKYTKWASYEPEEKGVLIVYSSMYGNTEHACQVLASKLHQAGVHKVRLYDVSNTHVSYLISESFKYSHIIFGAVTYNLGVYPPLMNFLHDMKVLNLQNRTIGILENGSWAAKAGDLIEEYVNTEMKTMDVLGDRVTMNSALSEGNMSDFNAIIESLADDIIGKKRNKED